MVGVTVILSAVVGGATLVVVDQAQNPPPAEIFETDQRVGNPPPAETVETDQPPAVTVETDQRVGVVVETNEFNGTDSGGQANRSVTFVHTAGESVDPDRLSVTVNGHPGYDVFDPAFPGYATVARSPIRSTFDAGTRLRVVVYGQVYTDGSESPSGLPSFFHNSGTLQRSLDDPNAQRANELRPGDTVRLVWTSPSGLNSYVLVEHTVR
jgi:FlaG/FlaF family flagellin (archaellin)